MNKKNSHFCLSITVILSLFAIANCALAYEMEVPISGKQSASTPAQYLDYIYTLGLILVGIASLAAVVFGGFLYMTSGGNQTRAGEGKKWIAGAVTGLILLLCSYLILQTINPDLLSSDMDVAGAKITDLGEGNLENVANNEVLYGPIGGYPDPATGGITSTRPPGMPADEATLNANADQLSNQLSYGYGANDPNKTDCSGGVQRLAVISGRSNPGRSSAEMIAQAEKDGTLYTDLSQLQPGDIIVRTAYSGSQSGRHVGMYMGNNTVWDSQGGSGPAFRKESLNSFMSRGDLIGAVSWK